MLLGRQGCEGNPLNSQEPRNGTTRNSRGRHARRGNERTRRTRHAQSPAVNQTNA